MVRGEYGLGRLTSVSIMPQNPPSRAEDFSRETDLCCLEVSCNSRGSLGSFWKLATLKGSGLYKFQNVCVESRSNATLD